MKQFFLTLLIFMPLSGFAFDREIRIELGGLYAGRLAVEAVAEEASYGWEWFELRQRYSLVGVVNLRDYDDGRGWYYSLCALATIGRIDIAGGAMAIDGAAGLHHSALDGGYSFTDFTVGLRANSNLTFWMERSYAQAELAYLIGNRFDVLWGSIKFEPLKKFSIGVGFHRDGELLEWSKPLPFQSAEDWPDKWDGGVNYFITLGYRFEL